ncbi:MAG TPA: carboxypeptidase regulatory-like domain-containing protein [Thermoanaerobaculia bacterium]|nr:carboxypeptidase regulatory-like domain-containing protein [Thermoanaerobaculia bacterium]
MRRPLLALATLVLCLAALPSFAAINGTLMTSDGQPVAGARVSIFAYESSEARRARLLSATPEAVPLATGQTDAKGSFSLASPKDAVVELAIYARGYAPVQRRVERDEEVGAITTMKVDMQSGSVTAGGKPVAGALVVIGYGGFEYQAKTGEDGKYEAPDIKRARSVAVIHPKYAIDEENFVMSRAAASKLQRTLVAGSELKGKVTGLDGEAPVGGATITLDNWPLATSGEDGTFTLAHVPAKWNSLAARKDALRGGRGFSKDASQTIRLAKAATLTGRILDGKTKVPIVGAIVTAGVPRMGMGPEAANGITDAKGVFTIAVQPGSYMLMAMHPAYDMNQIDASVAGGQSVSKDLSLMPMARVTGIVVDEANKPVAAAAVTSEFAGDPMTTMVRAIRMGGGGDAASGPDGRFAIRMQGDEEQRLKAAKKGMPLAKSETLKLSPGERKSGVVLTIPSGVAVTGKVTDASGKPLSGVAVTAAEAEPGRAMQRIIISGFAMQEEDAVRTGSDGSFAMRLKEGSYDFTFKREGYAMTNVRAQSVTASGNNVVEAKMDPAVEVRGRVTRNGGGVADVNVFAMVMGSDSRTTTGPDGSFTLSGLTPGQVRISLRKDDEFVQESRNVTAPSNDVVIELPAGSRVSGRVVEKGTRKPVTQFQAGLSRSRGGGGMVMFAPPQLKSFTSDDGTFTLEGVPAGAQDLVVTAPGFASGRLNVNVEEAKELTGVEIELDTGTRLTGKVTGPNGAPLPDVSVSLAFGPGSSTARTGAMNRTVTDSNGEYTLESLQSGDETVEFSHPKYVGTRKDVTLKGREVRLDAQLGGGQRVTGTVVTEAGAPVADAEVSAMASGASRRTATTNASGMFEFESLASARYRFTASKAGLADGRVEDFDINAGAPLRITMRTGGTIYGHITGLTPEELSNTTVDVSGGGSFSSASVDSSGNYKLEGAPTGTVQVIASMTSRSFTGRRTTPAQTVQLEAGSSRQVDLEFNTGTVIRGRVTRNGMPLKGANLAFTPKNTRGQGTSTTSTDDDGRYSITGLDDGEYNVTVIDLQRFSPYNTSLQVHGSSTFDIDYRANALRGRVLDSATNTPLGDANVQLRNSDPTTDPFRGMRAATTDASGTFVFDSVASGSYVVNATKDGYGNQATDVYVGDRSPDDLEVRLARNDGVTLKVVDARDGRALEPVVTVYDAQGRLVYENRMSFGSMEGANDAKLSLAAGRYTAWVSSIGYAQRSVSFTSPSTQTVALTPGGTVIVRSKQQARARVRLIDASGMPYPRFGSRPTWTDLSPSPGTSQIEHVAPGTYTLQLLGDNDAVLDSVRVTVSEGQVATTEI